MEKTKSGTPITCNEAALFKNKEKTLYLYRTKEGDWVTGWLYPLSRDYFVQTFRICCVKKKNLIGKVNDSL